jgi:deoxyadenosine/deoxycytidine kinase
MKGEKKIVMKGRVDIIRKSYIFRNRNMEKSIPIDYLTNLAAAYESFIKDISKVIPVIKVDWNEYKTPEVLVSSILMRR